MPVQKTGGGKRRGADNVENSGAAVAAPATCCTCLNRRQQPKFETSFLRLPASFAVQNNTFLTPTFRPQERTWRLTVVTCVFVVCKQLPITHALQLLFGR